MGIYPSVVNMTDSKNDAIEQEVIYKDLPCTPQYLVLVMAQLRLAQEMSAKAVEEVTDIAAQISAQAMCLAPSDETDAVTELSFELVTKTQFFDYQTQQVQHILSCLNELVNQLTASKELDQNQLAALTEFYRKTTTMAEERTLIDGFANGEDLQAVIAALMPKAGDDADCVLF